MKKALISFLAGILVISGCSSTTTSTTENNPLYYAYGNNSYSIQVPNDWEVITEFTSNYPQNTIAAFRNNVKNDQFIANINIVANTVEEGLSNGDYALEMLQSHSESLIDYKLLEKTEININVGGQLSPTYMTVFQGRNSVDGDLLQFTQIYGINKGFGYIATATLLPDEDQFVVETAIHMIESLEVK
ncbi:MAG: hypothetical protein ACD_51C00271G0001 [uncultured bacterium]|nr:MAG: hypothetical protein ACD_51C00271G0001 [uncultured bacterium]OGJ47792.1 MAG: hypothetical protein A2244_04085 [Candidatus Peregrinibacteria bacterium RIFOXYA2_FULL_41_18]OGJ49099.1 MAG: hypothetical protein A2344_05995 [Candidatus Peregrinibacteria bacterium RIFOXYB12_FULL_41_12]OGJ53340.1 MAG: hypothetical protein A2448_04200 [Candidatus Peregrinibacteria bacterium RIFOXYC2_FULL_41_22]